jgi:ribosomal protein S18 acetylase RimI-like enzyme
VNFIHRISTKVNENGVRNMIIRAATEADLPAMKAVLDGTDLFPSDMLDEMMAGYLGGAPEERWLVADAGGVVGLAYVAAERLTEGTFNLLAMAVLPARQGQGLGRALVAHVEGALAAEGARVLLVETSGLPDFARTREFYAGCGFVEEARIREFYAAGEDKVVFWKRV